VSVVLKSGKQYLYGLPLVTCTFGRQSGEGRAIPLGCCMRNGAQVVWNLRTFQVTLLAGPGHDLSEKRLMTTLEHSRIFEKLGSYFFDSFLVDIHA
jgi:hypothetical protein